MIHNLLKIFWVDGVKDVEEIFTTGASLCRVLVMEVDVKIGIIFKILPKIFYTELIPSRHVDKVDLIFLFQLLLARENVS